MVIQTLLLIGVLQAAIAGVYTVVGSRVGRRELRGDDLVAMRLFQLWWFGLGGITFVSGLFSFAGAFGYTNLAAYEALLYALILVLCAALWGLAYYLAYLFTGRRGSLIPLAVFYAGFFLYLLYIIAAADPVAVEVGRWQTTVKYANEDALGGPATRSLVFLLLAPQILGAIAYGSLFFKAEDRTARYRIATVSMALLGWFGSSIVASVAGINETGAWRIASQAVSLGASLLILMAYRPPGWIRRRLAPTTVTQGMAA